MKTALTLCLALLALPPASAQVFGPRTASGAVFGGMTGALIGRHSGSLGHSAWRGAGYGVGAGLLFGAAADHYYLQRMATRVPVPSSYYPRAYVYREVPVGYYHEPIYADEVGAGRSSYATQGLLLGALTGAILGNNSGSLGHNAWRGAAYGAGAGLLLGALADHQARPPAESATRTVVSAPPPAPAVTPAPAAPAAPATPMTSANALFGRN